MASIVAAVQPSEGVTSTRLPGSLKRASSDEQEQPPSQMTKKRRVEFDPDVEVRILEEWSEKGMELVREEVRHAIREQGTNGESATYEQIRQLFKIDPKEDDAPSTTVLRKYIVALAGHVGSLNRKCNSLVHAVLDFPWLVRDESFVIVYIKFQGSLVSAQGAFTRDVLKGIVKTFIEGKKNSVDLPAHPLTTHSPHSISTSPRRSSTTAFTNYFSSPSESQIHTQPNSYR